MKAKVQRLMNNELFILFINGTFAYIALTAVIIATLQIPPEVILETNLVEVIKVFEG